MAQQGLHPRLDKGLEQPQVLQQMQHIAVDITYKKTSSPAQTLTVTVNVDGSDQILDVAGGNLTTITMPTATERETRRIWLPHTATGWYPHLEWAGSGTIYRHQFISVPMEAFKEQQLWHYYEVTYNGTVDIRLFVDGTTQSGIYPTSLTTTAKGWNEGAGTKLGTETERVYFPFGSVGYLPHIETTYNTDGRIISARPIAQKEGQYVNIRQARWATVTYAGAMAVEFGVDGTSALTYPSTGTVTSTNAQDTIKLRLPPGMRGTQFQWRQTAGTGRIISVQTDESLEDLAPNQIEKTEG